MSRSVIEKFLKKKINAIQHVGGGCINEAYKIITSDQQQLFCKINSNKLFPEMFLKEKNGVSTIGSTNTIKVPDCILAESDSENQVLVMEWITKGSRTEAFWKKFGEQLAALHCNKKERYGFFEDNYMGALPQYNNFQDNWIDFFIINRLEPQIKLASGKGHFTPEQLKRFKLFCTKLSNLLEPEIPVVVHGDLWGGNFICSENGDPVMIDPAVYYGNRHIDLAMTTLFGGFDKQFYASYHYHFPLPSDHLQQWKIYNLYPLLVHLNLFGKSYLPEIIGTIDAY